MDASRDDAAASDLFKKLLSPPPTAEDVRLLMEESGHLMTLKDLRNINEPRCGVPPSFVVNRKAAQELCAQLEPHVFTTLSYPFQMRILVLMDIGLAAGVCSAVRLRLGCESNTQPMSLVRRLLDLLKKVATRTGEEGIMQILGRVLRVVCYARVKVDELKWILQELCSPSATTKPLLFALGASQADINDDVEIYCRSTSTGHLPRLPTVRSIFNFDGVGSGLVLPEMPWPFAQEYQFSFWERLEQGCGFIADTTDESATRRAHLVTFTTRGGAGVDYFLEGSHLFVSVADGRSSGQVQARVVDIGDLGLNRGKWHTLTIVHKRSSALLFNKDQLRIYVDEEEAFSGNVPFPRQVNEPLTHCSVGWDLDGQTSGVLIFSRAADRGVTAEILKRLADHTESSPADLNLSQDLTNNSRWDILRAKPLSSRCQILAALMPDRTVNGLCLETHHGYHAKLREHRTHAWTVWLAQDVIRSIGGTPSLLPMASILLTDSPVCTGENVDTVIFLMLSFLVGNDTNQHDFLCARAMGVLEVLLRSAPEGAFASAGAHTVMALEGMYLCCGSRWSSLGSQGQSGSVEHPVVTQAETNSLQQQVASDLLTNFVLWARAPPEMQFGLAARVLDLVRYDPGHFRSFLPVEKILTSLSICYPDRIPGDGPQTVNVGGRLDAMLDEDSDHEGANPAEAHQERKAWTTMARRERQHMRGCLWEVIRLLLNEGTTQQDGTAIVHLLASCADAKVVCELVQMLGAVMRQLKPPPGIFRAMETASRRCTHHLESRVVDRDVTSNGLAAGFVPLVLQRCVRADGVSEDLRVAGLRAASVFMVRSNKNGDVPANPSGGTTSRDRRQSLTSETGTGQVSSEVTVEALSKTVFPLLSEALSRDRHHLGETTYVALLEMALLVDERDVPWCDQIHVTNIVKNVSMQQGFSGDTSDDQHKRKQRRGSTTSLEATSSLWWDLQEDTNDGRINGLIIDDTQLLHNILPLALIMQHLPNMATSVQVYSHSELLLMLKVNEGNRQKLYELSHANSDVFWGLWERYLFIMMGPAFARSQGLPASRSSNIQDVEERRVEVSHDSISGEVTTDAERAREGDYFMVVSQGTLSIPRMVISTMHKLTSHTQEVLELYALVLERAMLFDDEGYREIELVASLQPSIPRGDVAARLLLAQLALRLGRQGIPGLSAAGAKGSMHKSTSKSGGFPPSRATPSMSNWSEPVDDMVQPLWNNVVQLAFVAANLVSDDISTITGGLFSEDDDLYRDEHLTRDEPIHNPGLEARRLSSAASGSPVLLCSSPDVDASVALSMRVLSLFCVSSEGSAIELDKICTSQSTIPSQGPLMWPLLRLSLFLLVRLHPCTQSARENASFFGALVRTLVSPEWCDWCAERDCEPADSDDMCMVVLAHVHAALLRLHAQMSAMVDLEHRRLPLASDSGTAGMASVERLAELSESSGQHFENTMFDCLERLTRRQTDLLNRRLGERVTSALGEEVTAEVRRRRLHEETELAWAQPDGEKGHIRVSWDDVARNLAWMGNSFVMMSSSKSSAMGSGERTSLPEACVRSLKAAEELESRAVQAGRECFQEWQTVVNRAVATLFVTPDLQAGASDMLLKQEVLRAARDQAEKTEALSAARKERRLVEARQRLQGFKRNFGAAWSPWAKGVDPASKFEPMGWEISSHKDQRMRQMLLVPVDRNVRHAEASYYGKNTSPGALSEESSRSGNLTGDAALLEVPALRPSASLLAGDDGFIDDEEDEPAAQDELDSSISADADADADANHASSEGKDWEDISELEAGHQIWHDFLSTTSLSDGVNEDILQHARGTWTVTMVFRESSVQGTLYVFAECLVIRSFREPSEGKNQSASSSASSLARHYGKTWYWQLRRLTQLHLRRYLLSPQAVELFWADSPEIFLAFEDVQGRQNFTRVLRKQHVPMLPFTTLHGTLHPRKVLKESRLTELWRRRQISNFRYIMELNVIAGRSYNDVTQYPVFPWVLSDYSSDTLDLGKAQSFRDLRKPIGAINENRRELFMERYSTFDDELVPKFMYGTHYSSAGVVLHYLVRQEPFTSLHIQLQDGSFDCPDRLFQDLQQCWDGCVDGNNLSDVKELTPEFFYLPEMFLNTNKLPLGELQGKTGVVNDVRLPPWAKDAHDFVRLHRLALESEYVSRNLHHWIDLVFGYKQRGQEAVKAANVFYYLTYEGAVDLSQVNDPQRREAMELQIRHFGQTPSQLLLEPHPARLPLEECVLPLFSSRSMLERLRVYTPRYWPRNAERRPALLVHCTKERLLCVDASLRVTTWAFSGLPNGRGQPFTLEPGRSVCIPTGSLHMSALYLNDIRDSSGRRVPGAESKDGETEDTELSPRCISRVHSCLALKMGTDGDPDSILSCGYWDHAIRCHSLDASAKLVLGARGTGGHHGAINCLCVAEGGSLLVTGGQDATCRVWVVGNAPMASALSGLGGLHGIAGSGAGREELVCVNVLYGHEAPVVSLAVSEELDATVSGATDGRIVVHCLKDGSYVRQFLCTSSREGNDVKASPEASQLTFSCHGDVVVHSWTDLSLHRFSINGAHLATGSAPAVMNCLMTVGGGEYLLAGGQDGTVGVYALYNLLLVHTINLHAHGGITCMSMSVNSEYLLVGSEDGEVSVVTDTKTRLRMLDLAMRNAFVG